MTKTKDLRELNLEELEQKLVESKHELFNLRFQLATGKQDNSARLGQVRREWPASPPCCASGRSRPPKRPRKKRDADGCR